MQIYDAILKLKKEWRLKQTSVRKGAFTGEKGGSWQPINTNEEEDQEDQPGSPQWVWRKKKHHTEQKW